MIFAKKEIINIFHYVIIPKCECECEFEMQNTAKVTNKKEIWSKMDILGLARTLLYTCTLIYRISFLFYIVHGISETGIFLICSLIPL